jgi:hypothetical protein
MKLPIILSSLLALFAAIAIYWVTKLGLKTSETVTILVYIVTALGGLVSAVFIIYGYFVNLSVFKESQKPKLLLQVHNQRKILKETSDEVHQTVLNYVNMSSNECRGLTIKLTLVGDNENIEIPRLFSVGMNIGPNDGRTREFPTLHYFRQNGIPEVVINNLDKYKLRASYSYQIMGEQVSSYYDYEWNKNEEWGIV